MQRGPTQGLAGLRAHASEADDDFTRALVAAALLADSPTDYTPEIRADRGRRG